MHVVCTLGVTCACRTEVNSNCSVHTTVSVQHCDVTGDTQAPAVTSAEHVDSNTDTCERLKPVLKETTVTIIEPEVTADLTTPAAIRCSVMDSTTETIVHVTPAADSTTETVVHVTPAASAVSRSISCDTPMSGNAMQAGTTRDTPQANLLCMYCVLCKLHVCILACKLHQHEVCILSIIHVHFCVFAWHFSLITIACFASAFVCWLCLCLRSLYSTL